MDKQTLIDNLNEDLAGEYGVIIQLENMVRDESSHFEETERILRDWPL